MRDTSGHSARYLIREAIALALAAEPAFAGLPIIRNPREASSLSKGVQVLVIKDENDILQSQTGTAKSGVTEKRVFSFGLGVVSRNEGADADADLLHVIATRVVRATLQALQQSRQVLELKESSVQFSVENLQIDGALVLGNWEVVYVRNRND